MPISYDLAKTLERAGWPQPDYKAGHGNGHWIQDGSKKGKAKVLSTVYAPSLSELIAACPRAIDGYRFTLGVWGDGWIATYWIGAFVGTPDGDTPEEAVARLWLTLKRGGEDA